MSRAPSSQGSISSRLLKRANDGPRLRVAPIRSIHNANDHPNQIGKCSRGISRTGVDGSYSAQLWGGRPSRMNYTLSGVRSDVMNSQAEGCPQKSRQSLPNSKLRRITSGAKNSICPQSHDCPLTIFSRSLSFLVPTDSFLGEGIRIRYLAPAGRVCTFALQVKCSKLRSSSRPVAVAERA